MATALPIELWVQILNELPAREPSTFATVFSFLSTNSVLRVAALQNFLWEKLYASRYTHCDEAKEEERRERLGNDFRSLFAERYKMDQTALRLLALIRTGRDDRLAIASQVAREMSFDVWDALQPERRLPIPRVFRDDESANDDEGEVEPHALPRRFWAEALMGVIARSHAARTWMRTRLRDAGSTFDDVLLGFSAFVGVSPQDTLLQLDELAESCRHKLVQQGIQSDPDKPGYNLTTVILGIRDFMHDAGFAVASGNSFANILNQFPPCFLGPQRSSTLPMSLCWVFAGISRRLGVRAGPTNTPGKVLCHITSPDPQHGDMLFDVCTQDPPIVFSSKDLGTMLAEAGMPSDSRADAVLPADLAVMVRRAAYNIFHFTRMSMFGAASASSADDHARADYAASLAVAAVCDPQELRAAPRWSVLRALPVVPLRFPLDRKAVLLDNLPFAPQEGIRFVPDRVRRRPQPAFRGFVGQVISMGERGLGCVYGWETLRREYEPPMDVYYVLMRLGEITYNLTDYDKEAEPAPVTAETVRQLRRECSCFDQYFEDVVIPNEEGLGGRLVPSEELQVTYPNDLEYGARWTEQQLAQAG
ncbi:hypothetical protein BD413DRAFT_704866, partial [Trametes elegans]